MIVFGKVRGADSLFRAKEYEKCISNVVVTHSPRYLIDLDIDDGNSFFDRANLSYNDISESDQPIKMITDYFLSIGQTAWWLAESTPAAIQMFGNLPVVQKGQLMGHAFVYFPEIFSNSGVKFYRYMSWLASENSIFVNTQYHCSKIGFSIEQGRNCGKFRTEIYLFYIRTVLKNIVI